MAQEKKEVTVSQLSDLKMGDTFILVSNKVHGGEESLAVRTLFVKKGPDLGIGKENFKTSIMRLFPKGDGPVINTISSSTTVIPVKI